jgi:hypothetical protein
MVDALLQISRLNSSLLTRTTWHEWAKQQAAKAGIGFTALALFLTQVHDRLIRTG